MRRHFIAGALLPLLAGCAARNVDDPKPAAVVFFSGDSAALDDAARSIIASVAEQAVSRPGLVRVLGFAAPPGSVGFNQALSDARAWNVADDLKAAGVAADRIRVEARGAVPFAAIPTESRRVEIIVGN